MEHSDLTQVIIGAAIEVQKTLGGPGLLESLYEAALCHELAMLGLQVSRQLPVPVMYKGVAIKDPFYLDVLVENQVIVEIKATEKIHPIYEVQLLTYLRLTNRKLGLMINFGNIPLKDGVRRVVNGL